MRIFLNWTLFPEASLTSLLLKFLHIWAYCTAKPGSSTALSKTKSMHLLSFSSESILIWLNLTMSVSNFCGVSLFKMASVCLLTSARGSSSSLPSALAFLVPGFQAFSAFFSSTCGPDMEGRLIRMVGGPPGPPGPPGGPPGPPRSRPGFWSDRFLVTLPLGPVVDLMKAGMKSTPPVLLNVELILAMLALSLIISIWGKFVGLTRDMGSLAKSYKKSRSYCFFPSGLQGDH